MYILANKETILKFPYTLKELYQDNPNISFHTNMSDEELELWGVFKVEKQEPPQIDEATELLEHKIPLLINGKWVQNWNVTRADESEIQERYQIKSELIRKERNRLLSETDYTQMSDYYMSPEDKELWISFRQSLRDISLQSGFPWNVEWPTLPKRSEE